MKILLLGASGQLGREWQAYFASLEADRLVVIPYTSDQLDVTNFDDVKHEIREQQPDIIINCAAYTGVDAAEEHREEAMQTNAEAVKIIAQYCYEIDCTLVHFSTDYIFAGKKKDREEFPNGYPENHNANPINWYGQTKWQGEEAIRNTKCEYVIMRISWLCGAFGSNFVKTMLQLAETRDHVDVVDDQIGSPTFTESLVKNTFILLKNEVRGTFHLTSEGMISWADFAEAIFELSEKNVEVNRVPSAGYPTKADRPFFSKLNTSKIKQVDGIKTENWKVGLSQLLKQINRK